MVIILGISAFYHDSAAALLKDGELVAAIQEERFSRRKHDPGFPHKSIEFCLKAAGIHPRDLDAVVFYEKPLKKFFRIGYMFASNLGSMISKRRFSPLSSACRSWLGASGKIRFSRFLRNQSGQTLIGFDWKKLKYVDHHYSHAASAFYPSPFEDALVLVMDGVGEWSTTTAYEAGGGPMHRIFRESYPNSLGLLYSAFTRYLGFRVNSGEYKVMGLAPYGVPRYKDIILGEMIHLREGGGFSLEKKYFDFWSGGVPVTDQFCKLLGGEVCSLDAVPSQREMDIAASIQKVTEEAVLHLVRGLEKKSSSLNLCLAGGVALNCVSNARLIPNSRFEKIWIQPASGDAGGALGAALLSCNVKRTPGKFFMAGSYLGTSYSDADVLQELETNGLGYEEIQDSEERNGRVAGLLCKGGVIGRFSGRMEFGPRALGNRSILGDPRNPEMQKRLNLKIKYRESFRPFAPSVLAEHASDWFQGCVDSPYMNLVACLKQEHRLKSAPRILEDPLERIAEKRSTVPAITHLDYTARLQIVEKEPNPEFYALIDAFYQLSGVPMIINTSFNVRGEPIVESPKDAIRCFLNTDMDYLLMGSFLLSKETQEPDKLTEFKSAVALD